MSVKTPSKHITKTSLSSIHPLSYRRDRLLPAAALAAAVLAGLLLYGLPLWQCLCWALAFGGLLPLGLRLGDRAAARLNTWLYWNRAYRLISPPMLLPAMAVWERSGNVGQVLST